jgi:hypothetical protein
LFFQTDNVQFLPCHDLIIWQVLKLKTFDTDH